MSDLMRHFATTNLQARDHIAKELQSVINQLNEALVGMGQTHFAELFRRLDEVTERCGNMMRLLREELAE